MKPNDVLCVELALGVTCGACNELVPVNGPRPTAQCACGAETALEGALRWAELLTVQTPPVNLFEALAQAHDGTVVVSESDRVRLTATRAWPKCECGRHFERTKLAGAVAASHATSACPACKKEIGIARPPASFRHGAPAVVAVVGAHVVADGMSRPGIARACVPWWAVFAPSRA